MPSSSEGESCGEINNKESAINYFPTKYCRLCALELRNGVFIFGQEGKRLQIPEKIRKTLGILVLEEDTLPKKICTDCCSSLEDYSKYKDTVLDAQEKLAAIAKNLEKNFDSEIARCNQQQSSLISKYSPPNGAKKPKILEYNNNKDDQLNLSVPENCSEVSVIPPSSSSSSTRQEIHGGPINKSFKCGFCLTIGETFYDQQKMLAHIAKIHPELKHKSPKYRCSECPKITDKYSAIRAHAYRHRKAGTHRCSEPNCTKVYSLKSLLDAHTLSQHCKNASGKAFSCKDCGKRFHTKTGLTSHATTKHDVEEMPKLSGPRHFEENIMSEDSSLPDCGPDDMIMMEQSTLTISDRGVRLSERISTAVMNGETGDTTTTSSSCGLNKVLCKLPVFMNNNQGDEEEKDYERENQQFKKFALPPVLPTTSSSSSSEPTNLVEGEKTMMVTPTALGEKPQERLWNCGVCNKVLTSNTGYHNHMMIHKGRRFDCDVCGVSYMQKATLVHHKKVHHVNAPKKFKCEVCSKEFHELKFLTQHSKIHSAPSPDFQCHICNKIYKTGRCLRRHVKLHTASKKYVCSLCDKAFRVKSKLDEHENSHTGKRPLGCQFCDKAFNGHPNYVKHMRRKHPTEIKNRDNKIPPPNKVDARVQAEIVTSSSSIEISTPTTGGAVPAPAHHTEFQTCHNNNSVSQPPPPPPPSSSQSSSSQTSNWHSIPGKNYINPSGSSNNMMSGPTTSSAVSVNALDLVDCAIQNALVGDANNGTNNNNSSNNDHNNCYDGGQTQSQPMELSYKLTAFQDMPMELTKVFQRDPLELCVRQDLIKEDFNQLMDLSSRDTGGIVSMSMNMAGVNIHRLDLTERELMDLSGAFRQPIDLISRTDDTAHDVYNEGSLVDLSLRSNFGQDQSASSFLRELIDLSSRSDSFHGELDLTKPHHPQQQQQQQQHGNTHQHHSTTTNVGIPNGHGGSSANGMSTSKANPTAGNNVGTLQNVIYQDAIDNMDTMYA